MKKCIIALFIISLLFMPKQGFALSCVEPSPPDIAFDEYDAVIIGIVVKIKETHNGKILTVAVDTSYKGVDENFITVEEDITWGTSQLNAGYLYFLDKDGEDWIHPLCSPTTDHTYIAEEFLADKETITLQNVEIDENESNYGVFVALLAVIVVIVLTLFLIRKRKKK